MSKAHQREVSAFAYGRQLAKESLIKRKRTFNKNGDLVIKLTVFDTVTAKKPNIHRRGFGAGWDSIAKPNRKVPINTAANILTKLFNGER